MYTVTSAHISDAVKKVRELDWGEESLDIAIVVREGGEESIEQYAEETDVEIDRILPSGVILVTLPDQEFESLVTRPEILSVTLRSEMEIME